MRLTRKASSKAWTATRIRAVGGKGVFEFEDGLLTVELDYVVEVPVTVVRTEHRGPRGSSEARHHVFALEQVPELLKRASRILAGLIKQGQVRVPPTSDAGGTR